MTNYNLKNIQNSQRKEFAISTLVIAGVIITSILTHSWFQKNLRLKNKSLVAKNVEHLSNIVYQRLERRLHRLDHLAKRYNHRSAEGWIEEVKISHKEFNDLQAIEWADRSTKVKIIYPLSGNEVALGLILNKEKERRLAIESAVIDEEYLITNPINLKQGGKGFLSIHPTYKKAVHNGFVVGVFKADKIFSAIVDKKYHVQIKIGDKLVFTQGKFSNKDSSNTSHRNSFQINIGKKLFKVSLYKVVHKDFLNINESKLYTFFITIFDILFCLFIVFNYRNRAKLAKSKERYKDVSMELDMALEGAGLGVWDWDLLDNSVRFDRRWCEMLGLKYEITEMNLSTWEGRVHLDDIKQCYLDIENYISGNSDLYENTHRMRHADGRWIYILDKGRISARDSNGKPIRFTGTHLDITLIKEQEAKISELYKTLNETALISETDSSGKITHTNESFQRISKYSAEELLGNDHRIVNSGHHSKEFIKNLWDTIQRGDVWRGEIKNKAKDGSFYWVYSSIYPSKNSNGDIEKFVSIRYDITDKKLNEENKLFETRCLRYSDKLSKILHGLRRSSSEQKDILDLYKIILTSICKELNWSVAHIYTVNQDDQDELLPSKVWYESSPYKFTKFIEVTEATNFRKGKGLPGRVLQSQDIAFIKDVNKDKNYPRNKKITNINLHSAIGIPVIYNTEVIAVIEMYSEETRQRDEALMQVLHDKIPQIGNIIEQFKYEESLRDARNLAEKSSKAKSDFLANMSHEIRTPMNGMLGMVSLLKDTKLNDNQREIVNTLDLSGSGLLSILNDILDFSKIESNKVEIERISFNINDSLNEITNLLSFSAKAKGTDLNYNISKEVPKFAIADITKIRQVLINLISNSIKFTASGKIDVIVTMKDDLLKFQVVDTGLGMNEESLSKLFTPFTQADNSTTRKFGGTGLGLSISKNLIKLMGGDIDVESQLGQGSTFTFTIPIEENNELEKITNHLEQEKTLHLKGPISILITEDNKINQKLAVAYLSKIGLSADIANDGVEAIKKVSKKDYDIVFMDLQMPNMGGIEATIEIKKQLEEASPIIVAMTANAFEEDKRACKDAGMSDFISKPVKIEKVIDILNKFFA